MLDSIARLNPIDGQNVIPFRRACEINPSSFVNFMYRCGQSFPNHPTMRQALSDWSVDKHSQNIFRAILANGLELLNSDERLAGYVSIQSSIDKPSQDHIFLERVLFSKILALFPDNTLEIIPLEIRVQTPVEVSNKEGQLTATNFIQTLFPENYCNPIIDA